MSLIRTALVLSIGIAVLPSDKESQARMYEQASAAANWTRTYCDRNPAHCDSAAVVWSAFVEKAKFAGQLAYDLALRSMAQEHGLTSPASFAPNQPTAVPPQGTLTPADLAPSWRGTPARQKI
jgi:hypothetical protein